ncbi:hypothetical protein GH733_005578 [Mirounga leonina]|nr:hypothetical protein GH733_005578 [Mirounga leonina]
MSVLEESRPFAQQLSNVYFTILSLFCFKLFVKISLAILSHFYIVKGNRKEAARIAAEFYGVTQGQDRNISHAMPADATVDGHCVKQILTKRRIASVEECSSERKASWGILTSQGSWADRSPLHEAASQGRLLALRTLLSQVNAITIDGVTPLFNACSQGSGSCTELLLEYGAKPQLESCLPSPTHEAASKGADVQKGKYWDTPLHAAAQQSSTEIVNLLLEFGADINAKNTELLRPVDVATSSSLVERLLLQQEATPSTLCQLCRLCIRNYIGRPRLHLIPQLQLPTLLQNFLQYR